MHHTEGRFDGPRGLDIRYQGWRPEAEAKAALIIVHGLAEHSGRYRNLVDHLLPRGYAVYGFDLPGHGRSAGRRVFVERFDDFDDTLTAFREMVREWHPAAPLFLLGHSMGGLIAAHHLVDRQRGLEGAILSGPAVGIEHGAPPLTALLARIASLLAPSAGVYGVDAGGISKDPAVVEAYVNDPLVHRGKASARLMAEMLRASKRVSAEAHTIRLPLVAVHGADDRLVEAHRTRRLFERLGSDDKTLHVYDGLYHEVFNEPERARVLADVERWLEARA